MVGFEQQVQSHHRQPLCRKMVDQLCGECFGGIDHRVARLDRPIELQQAHTIGRRLNGKRWMTVEPTRQPRQVAPEGPEAGDEMGFIESSNIAEAVQAETL